jgi:hypothetical protein
MLENTERAIKNWQDKLSEVVIKTEYRMGQSMKGINNITLGKTNK